MAFFQILMPSRLDSGRPVSFCISARQATQPAPSCPAECCKNLSELADEHDFLIASDECYSEIYPNEGTPPPGLLQAAAELGRHDYRRCLCFHSLSKRSNLPGLRSGFVAGDTAWIERFKRYRTYHGCAMPLHHQIASEWAWGDEQHVLDNRARYREKFAAVTPIPLT